MTLQDLQLLFIENYTKEDFRNNLWNWAKDNISKDELERIENSEDPFLELNVYILTHFQEKTFSLPPNLDELVKNYEYHKQKTEQEIAKNAHLSDTRIALIKKLTILGLDRLAVEEIADQAVLRGTIVETAKAIHLIDPNIAPETISATLAATGLVPENIITTISEAYGISAESANLIYTAVVTTTHLPKFSRPDVSARLDQIIGHNQTEYLVSNQARLEQVFAQLREAITMSAGLEEDLRKEIYLTGLRATELEQALNAIKYAAPVMVAAYQVAKTTHPDSSKSEWQYLARSVGLAYLSPLGLSAEISKVLSQSSLSSVYNNLQFNNMIQSATDNPALLAFYISITQNEVEFYQPVSEDDVHRLELPKPPQSHIRSPENDNPFDLVKKIEGIGDTLNKVTSVIEWTMVNIEVIGIGTAIVGFLVAGNAILMTGAAAADKVGLLDKWESLVSGTQGPISQVASGPLNQFTQFLYGHANWPFHPFIKFNELFIRSVLKIYDYPFQRFGQDIIRLSRLGGILNSGLTSVGTAALATMSSFVTVVMIIAFSIPIVVALLLFIINSSAFMVPPSGIVGNISNRACTVPQNVTASSPILARAQFIVDRLLPRFWGYYNKSPDYPTLFDEEKYKINPNPNPHEYTNLFWCTWLVVKTYNENSNPIPALIATIDMMDWFKKLNRFIPISEAIKGCIQPGDVAFVYTGTTDKPAQHVSIIAAVSQDTIQTVDSNAVLRSFTYTVSGDSVCWGRGCQLKIIGIGKQ